MSVLWSVSILAKSCSFTSKVMPDEDASATANLFKSFAHSRFALALVSHVVIDLLQLHVVSWIRPYCFRNKQNSSNWQGPHPTQGHQYQVCGFGAVDLTLAESLLR